MPRVCTVCVHAERATIDKALVSGQPMRELSALYRVSEDALSRHKAAHLPATLVLAATAQDAVDAEGLLRDVQALRNKAYSILLKAEGTGDYRTALAGIREARACLELLAEMEGQLNRQPTVNLTISAEWLAVRTVLLQSLQPFPEARQAVVASLTTLEAGNGHRG